MDTLASVKVGRKLKNSDSREPTPMIFAMRGSIDFKAWLQRAAEHCNLSVADFLTQAARDYAKRQGFGETQPRR